MIVKDAREDFSIEVVPMLLEASLLLGVFGFHIKGRFIGDRDDSTHLRACRNWMKDFVEAHKDRSLSGDAGLSDSQIFSKIYDSIYTSSEETSLFQNDISHIGMSSFDSFLIFYVEYPKEGKEKILWSKAGAPFQVHSVVYERGTVARNFQKLVDGWDAMEGLLLNP